MARLKRYGNELPTFSKHVRHSTVPGISEGWNALLLT